MYQLIITYDDGVIEIISGETKREVFKKAEKINFDEALWELKWVPSKIVITEAMVKNTVLERNI